jgi:hypothetical protein
LADSTGSENGGTQKRRSAIRDPRSSRVAGSEPRARRLERDRAEADDAPVLPPGGTRTMLPERQRLLETRLERPTLRPFNGFGIASAWERGPRGRLDLSVGLSVGRKDGFRNLALNGDLELTPWLRTHVTAVARPHHTRLSSERLLQEAYLEAFRSWRVRDGEFATSLRAGSTRNLAFPFPDALSLFDLGLMGEREDPRDLRGYKHLTGIADYSHRSGLGLHAAASKRVIHGNELGDTRVHMIDYYLRYRGGLRGLTLEARLGALNPGLPLGELEMPNRPRKGQALYIGKEWETAGAGLLFEKVQGSPARYGFRLNVPTGAVAEALGNFFGRYHRRERGVAAQLPLGSLLFGQRLTPPSNGERVGTLRLTRVYRSGSFLGADQYPLNYEYVVDREGVTEGPGLTRVLVQGPRYLSEGGSLGGNGLDGAQLINNYREDVTYQVYQQARKGIARLTVRVVDAASPDREVEDARVLLMTGGSDSRPGARSQEPGAPRGVQGLGRLLARGDGGFTLEESISASKPRAVRLMASAPGYLDEVTTATLKAGETETIEIRLKSAAGRLKVQLVNAETGEAISEAEVHIGAAGARPQVNLTDAKGTIVVPTLTPGRYRVSTYAPRYYDQKAEVAVSAAGSEQIVLRLKPRQGSIAGRILDGDGKPIAGAAVTISDAAGHGLGVMTSLSDGTFGMTGLKPGRYEVSVKVGGGATGRGTAEVKAGEIETVDITIGRPTGDGGEKR